MRIAIALGGNALLRRSDPMTIVALGIGMDLGWKRTRDNRASHIKVSG
jgi:hypothetical protein